MDHIYFQSYYHFHPYLIELNVKQFSFFFCRNFKNLRRFVLADIFWTLKSLATKIHINKYWQERTECLLVGLSLKNYLYVYKAHYITYTVLQNMFNPFSVKKQQLYTKNMMN